MITLTPTQVYAVRQGVEIVRQHGFVYLMMKTRTGKTFASFEIGNLIGFTRACFITTKKNIKDIRGQAKDYNFKVDVINYESAHKLKGKYGLVILDEAHNLGTYPKVSLRWKKVKELCIGATAIFLSATPTPESWSSIFHQLRLSDSDPFKEYASFYRWADTYVNKKKIYCAANPHAISYKDARIKEIKKVIDKFCVTVTQEQAGFVAKLNESILRVSMSGYTKLIYDFMANDSLLRMRSLDIVISGENATNRKNKCHQICSGTVKNLDDYYVIDNSKGYAIKEHREALRYRKIVIFYKYIAERQIIENVFGKVESDPQKFQKAESGVFISQIQSGREGLRLDSAECLYMFNIDFAWLSYEQALNRIMSMDRVDPAKIVWVFSDIKYEDEILEKVMNKEDFTVNHFRRML